MKLCSNCLDKSELICDWCKHFPTDEELGDDYTGDALCKKLNKIVNLIQPACDDFHCFMRDKEEEQGGLF